MDSQKLLEITKDPRKALDFARAYKKEGKYEQALEMHEWYHFNALSIRPSLYGVRLGSVLWNWIQLAEIYPKAKQRLIDIRSEEIMKIKNGNWDFKNFQEIKSISKELKDYDTPVEIFKLICKKETDKDKVNKCFDIVFEFLVNKGEVELCRKYLDNPLERVKDYINGFNDSKISINAFIQEKGGVEGREHVIQEIRQAHKNIYISDISLLVRALKLLNMNKEIEEVYIVGKGIIPDEEYQKIFT